MSDEKTLGGLEIAKDFFSAVGKFHEAVKTQPENIAQAELDVLKAHHELLEKLSQTEAKLDNTTWDDIIQDMASVSRITDTLQP